MRYYVIEDSMESNTMRGNIRNASILFGVCLPGFVMNVYASIVLLRHPSFQNTFGKFVAFHTVSNAALLSCLLIWSTPITVLSSFTTFDSPLYTFVNNRVGQLAIAFQECSYHISFFISLNRLFAIGKPVLSRRVFNERMTNYMMLLSFSIASVFYLTYFLPGCNFLYLPATDVWTFDDTFCGGIIAFIDLYYNFGVHGTSCLLDIITLILLQGANDRLRKTMGTTNMEEAKRRQRKEIIFFTQAFNNTIIFVLMQFSFHIISSKFEDPFYIFIFTTVAWALGHALSGLNVILFNREIRRGLMCWRKEKRKPNVVTTLSSLKPASVHS